jgi:hypothetical protein
LIRLDASERKTLKALHESFIIICATQQLIPHDAKVERAGIQDRYGRLFEEAGSQAASAVAAMVDGA